MNKFLKVEKMPKVCWNDSFTWGMTNCMHDVVLAIMKHVSQNANFFSLNCDEVTTIDN